LYLLRCLRFRRLRRHFLAQFLYSPSQVYIIRMNCFYVYYRRATGDGGRANRDFQKTDHNRNNCYDISSDKIHALENLSQRPKLHKNVL